jgi:hypothetical protein
VDRWRHLVNVVGHSRWWQGSSRGCNSTFGALLAASSARASPLVK